MIPWTEGQAQIQIEQPLKHTEQLRFTSQNKRVDYPIYSGHWEKDIFVYQLPWDFFVLPIALCVCVCCRGGTLASDSLQISICYFYHLPLPNT